jgi:hypothetical protein
MTQILDREISLADMADFEFGIPCSGITHPSMPYHDNGDAKFWVKSVCPDCQDTITRAVCAKFAECMILYPQIAMYCIKCDWVGVAGDSVTILGSI